MAITLRITKNRVLTLALPGPEQLPWLMRILLLMLLGISIIVTLFFSARMLIGRTIFPSSVTTDLPKTVNVNTKVYTKIREADEVKRARSEPTVLRDPFGTGETFTVQ